MKLSFENKVIDEINPEKSILENLKISGYTVSHSCLNGRCLECKIKVTAGTYYMPNNQEGLTSEEIAHGYCLSCITKPKSDLIVEEITFIEGVLPEVSIIPSKISELQFLTDEVARIILRTPTNSKLEFLAGQYINLIFKNIKRSYSLASSPSKNKLELIVKKYPNGKFSEYLFNEAKVNDLIRIEGPYGTYILPLKLKDRILFISTGTGIAPNISILNFILENGLVMPENITFIHGQRFVKDHVYALEQTFPKIKILKAISREKKIGFFNGYVQNIITELNLDLVNTQVFACGNPNMIIETKSMLKELGLDASNFKSEIFISSN
jgi:CDP-4-dehydro-6-deoxyglucose reductase